MATDAPDVRVHIGGRRTHEPNLQAEPAVKVLARSANLRLTVNAAKARIGMWQACPAMDPARDADQVLAEVLQLLDDHEVGPR